MTTKILPVDPGRAVASSPPTPAVSDIRVKSAIAHLGFVAIHLLDDGNGRIARAIADGVLARAEQSGQRFYSMSAQIRKERNAHYGSL